jgi:glutamine synthetase
MALGAVVFAGADGIARALAMPARDAAAAPLPRALAEALDAMQASTAVQSWFGPTFLDAYLRHKRAELATLTDLDPEELCDRYAGVY